MQILVLLLVSSLMSVTAVSHAQTFISQFSSSGDSSSANGSGSFNVYNNLKATSSPVVVRWRVIGTSSNLTAAATEWGADGLCDNITCYAGGASLLGGQVHTTDPMNSSTFSTFYALLNGTNAPSPSTAWMRVEVKDTASGGTLRNLTFIGVKGTTGVAQTVAEDGLQVFPNPAANMLTVSMSGLDDVAAISVHSVDGKEVMSQPVQDVVTTFSVQDLPPGTYVLRLISTNGRAVAMRRITRN